MLNDKQIKMARAALGWTADRLAVEAGVAVNTVRRIEMGKDANVSTVAAIQRALEAAGVEFISTERGEGVILISRKEPS